MMVFNRFVLLQAIAWSLYSCVVLAFIIAGFFAYRGVKQIAIEVLASLGAGGVLAQLLLILSLHFFTTSSQEPTPSAATHDGAVVAAQQRRRGPLLGWWGVGNVGVALTLFSFALAMMVPFFIPFFYAGLSSDGMLTQSCNYPNRLRTWISQPKGP
jgi:hypothetical protein